MRRTATILLLVERALMEGDRATAGTILGVGIREKYVSWRVAVPFAAAIDIATQPPTENR